MNSLSRYLAEIRNTRLSGVVPETSYYPAVAELLNTIGLSVTPNVRCVVHPKNLGAGIPDMALFSADQIPVTGEPNVGILPSRGVVEIKGVSEKIESIAQTKQVSQYTKMYGSVLITNLREFLLVVRDNDDKPVPQEGFSLAPTEAAFWNDINIAETEHDAFVNYLKRVLVFNAPITTPKALASLLASYAKLALGRIEHRNLALLLQLREELEETLGIKYTGHQGDHFFRSTLIQTLFYGIFSAWVLWHQRGGRGHFDWHSTAYELRVPMIRTLFYQAANPNHLETLGLVEILNWAGKALNRVDPLAFFSHFAADKAVQYFYEPFLQEFDPELRKELGIWYTPHEIVRYQVARIDEVLREELGIADGLADPAVIILDPCCGTGAYLVEVVRFIHKRIVNRGDLLDLAELKRAVRERIFGFEILSAPFVVAHLQLGLLLQELGVPLSADGSERASIFLTNALTGWDEEPSQKALIFPELAAERDAANQVKQKSPILVILGNPPYNGYAGIAETKERGLSEDYRVTKKAPKPQGQGLNDLYVRFFRMAERRIVEQTGAGIVSFISNYSWLDGLSFTGMRERYMEVFDKIWIDNCNGDKYRTGKLTPNGQPDPSVFSTPYNREGIQVGTAVSMFVRKWPHAYGGKLLYREFWGKDKLKDIDAAKDGDSALPYVLLDPPLEIGLPFSPATAGEDYLKWPLIPSLFPVSFPGIKTSRDDIVTDIDLSKLKTRMEAYFDLAVSHDTIKSITPGAITNGPGFNAVETREFLQKRGIATNNFFRYCYRPFDIRWLYWETETKLIDRPRVEYVMQVFPGNAFLFTTGRTRKSVTEPPLMASELTDLNCMDSGARGFPMKIRQNPARDLFSDVTNSQIVTEPRWNLSEAARIYLAELGASPELLFFHALAIMHSQKYRDDNVGALRQDWPRIPLPSSRKFLEDSANIGKQIAALLDMEVPIPGVSAGIPNQEVEKIAILTRDGGGAIAEDDFAVTAGWGIPTKTGVMPGRGKLVDRPTTEGTPLLLGSMAQDIYLNSMVAWRNVPTEVWSFTIGGYPVLKKWLSYREKNILGRNLSFQEVRELQQIARRIAMLLLLVPSLDENYNNIHPETYVLSQIDVLSERAVEI